MQSHHRGCCLLRDCKYFSDNTRHIEYKTHLAAIGMATSVTENPEKLLDRGLGAPTLGKKLALGIGATFFGLSDITPSLVLDLAICPVFGPGFFTAFEFCWDNAGSGWPSSEKVMGTGLNEVLRSTCVCPYTVVALTLALVAANDNIPRSDIEYTRDLAEVVDWRTSVFEDTAS